MGSILAAGQTLRKRAKARTGIVPSAKRGRFIHDNNTPDTVTTTPDNNTPDTVIMARLEREKNGPWEAELSYGGEADLYQHYQGCKKNRGHRNFVPVDQFNMNDLPPGYRENRIVDKIRNLSNRTVRVSVRYVSDRRPETFPGTDKPYPCYSNRGSNLMRVGTGVIESIDKSRTENDTDDAYDCNECLSSGNRKRDYARIYIYTATHVVFDELEAADTTCHLFFDKGPKPDVCKGVVKLSGMSMGVSDIEKDRCILIYVTHDMDLADRLAKKLGVVSSYETYFPFSPCYPPDPWRDYNDRKTMELISTLCWTNVLVQNLTNIMIQRLEDILTQEQFDIRIKTLHDHVTNRLEYIDTVDFTSIEVERLRGDLIEIFEHILKDNPADKMQVITDNKMHKQADILKMTQAVQTMTNNLTETLTDEEISSLTDTRTQTLRDDIAHSLTGILKVRLTNITQEQRDHLTQTLTDIMKHRLTDSLKERLTDNKANILRDTTHKLIDNVTQSLLDGLIKRLIESLTEGRIDSLESIIKSVLDPSMLTIIYNQQRKKVLTAGSRQIERMVKRTTRIDSLKQTLNDYLKSDSRLLNKLYHSMQRVPQDVTDNLTREVNSNIQVTIDRLAQIFVDNMNHLLINSLTQRQTDSPHATNSNKVTRRESIEMTERFLTGLSIIVSHPHGCSKQVSVGFCTQRWDQSDKWKEYVYTTATCPGSSGAPVFVYASASYFEYLNWFEHLLHSGNFEENKELNFSYSMRT